MDDDGESSYLTGIGVGVVGEGVDARIALAFQLLGPDRVFEVVMDVEDATAFMRMLQTAIIDARASGVFLD
jgi:hypothetical protein